MATRFETDVYENKLIGELNGVRLYRRTEGPMPGFTLQVDGKVRKFVRATRAWKAEQAAITREAEALAGGTLAQLRAERIRIIGNTVPAESHEHTLTMGGFHAAMHPSVSAFEEDLGPRRRSGQLGQPAEQVV